MYKDFIISGNVSYAQLESKMNNDGLEESLNTPRRLMNIGISNREITKRLGFNLIHKWQAAFV